MQPFGRNRYGPKIGGLYPFEGRGAGSPSNSVARAEPYLHTKFHLDPSNGLAAVHERHRQDRTDRTNITDRTDNNLIA